jgi:hypothetical protein
MRQQKEMHRLRYGGRPTVRFALLMNLSSPYVDAHWPLPDEEFDFLGLARISHAYREITALNAG